MGKPPQDKAAMPISFHVNHNVGKNEY